MVAVDFAAVRERLRAAGKADLAAWEQARALLRKAVGESTFEIWLAGLELIAVDVEGTLLVSAPAKTVGWVARRFGRVLDGAAERAGRRLRVAADVERKAAESLTPAAVDAVVGAAPVGLSADARFAGQVGSAQCPADTRLAISAGSPPHGTGGRRDDQSIDKPTYTSAYPPSYTDVYNKTREVS